MGRRRVKVRRVGKVPSLLWRHSTRDIQNLPYMEKVEVFHGDRLFVAPERRIGYRFNFHPDMDDTVSCDSHSTGEESDTGNEDIMVPQTHSRDTDFPREETPAPSDEVCTTNKIGLCPPHHDPQLELLWLLR